jgi:hypothetical protein
MSSEHETGTRIADLTSRLAALDRARAEIIVDLAELRRSRTRGKSVRNDRAKSQHKLP